MASSLLKKYPVAAVDMDQICAETGIVSERQDSAKETYNFIERQYSAKEKYNFIARQYSAKEIYNFIDYSPETGEQYYVSSGGKPLFWRGVFTKSKYGCREPTNWDNWGRKMIRFYLGKISHFCGACLQKRRVCFREPTNWDNWERKTIDF